MTVTICNATKPKATLHYITLLKTKSKRRRGCFVLRIQDLFFARESAVFDFDNVLCLWQHLAPLQLILQFSISATLLKIRWADFLHRIVRIRPNNLFHYT